MIRGLPILAAISGLEASIVAGMPTNPNWLEVLGRWPLTVILGAVCVVCVYMMYRQAKDAADRSAATAEVHCKAILAMAEGERTATATRIASNAAVTKELAENNAREIRMLVEELIKKNQFGAK